MKAKWTKFGQLNCSHISKENGEKTCFFKIKFLPSVKTLRKKYADLSRKMMQSLMHYQCQQKWQPHSWILLANAIFMFPLEKTPSPTDKKAFVWPQLITNVFTGRALSLKLNTRWYRHCSLSFIIVLSRGVGLAFGSYLLMQPALSARLRLSREFET